MGKYTGNTKQPLKVLINKAVRIMTFAPYRPLGLKPIYKELEFLDILQTFLLDGEIYVQKDEESTTAS